QRYLIGIHAAKFALPDALLQRMHKFLMQRAKEFVHHPVEAAPRFQCLALHETWIVWMGSQEIEIAAHDRKKSLARRRARLGNRENPRPQLAEKIFEHGSMQAALVAEVVVEHRLVRMRRHGNFFRAGPRQALRAKVLRRGGKNAPRGRGLFSSSPSASHSYFRLPACSCTPRDTARPQPRRAETPDRAASGRLA